MSNTNILLNLYCQIHYLVEILNKSITIFLISISFYPEVENDCFKCKTSTIRFK